jgi:transketolase
MATTYEEALLELSQRDDRLVVMTAENRSAIRGLPPKLGGRFIDVGICEQTMIGMAAGLALRGRVPFCHALATFLTLRAFEFIRTDLGIPGLPAVLVGSVAGFLSEANGPTHQAIEDVSIMRGIPGMRVVCPADREEQTACVPVLFEEKGPSYVRYNSPEPRVKHRAFELGVAEQLSDGDDVAILVCGLLLYEALEAARLLQERGRSVRLLNLRSLAPIDSDAVLKAARECRLLVTFEDHFQTGGLFTIIAELLVAHHTLVRVVPIALDRRWFEPTLMKHLLDCEGFTGNKLAARIDAALSEST